MVFKKGQNQAHKSIKDLMEFWRCQLLVNDSAMKSIESAHTCTEELKEFADRLERIDWALLDYIKQQEFVIQSLEKRLYNVEKFVTTFAAAIEEK